MARPSPHGFASHAKRTRDGRTPTRTPAHEREWPTGGDELCIYLVFAPTVQSLAKKFGCEPMVAVRSQLMLL
jgi:hypothetical protein